MLRIPKTSKGSSGIRYEYYNKLIATACDLQSG